MKKLKRFCFVLLILALACSTGYACLCTLQLQNTLASVKTDYMNDLLSLRRRIGDMEALASAIPTLNPDASNKEETETIPSRDDPPCSCSCGLYHTTHSLPTALKPGQFFIRSYQGLIAVFDDQGQMIQTLNVALLTLSDEEQAKLQAGIVVPNQEVLEQMISYYS